MNTRERLGRSRAVVNAWASSITATVPDPSSSAPLQIESAPRAVHPSPAPGVPMWSMWAVNSTYSFLSVASPPSRMATTLGADVRSSSCWCTASCTRTSAREWAASGRSPQARSDSGGTPVCVKSALAVPARTANTAGIAELDFERVALQIGPAVAAGLEAETTEFTRHVRRDLIQLRARRSTAEHRVSGDDADAAPYVLGRDPGRAPGGRPLPLRRDQHREHREQQDQTVPHHPWPRQKGSEQANAPGHGGPRPGAPARATFVSACGASARARAAACPLARHASAPRAARPWVAKPHAAAVRAAPAASDGPPVGTAASSRAVE